MKAKRTYKDSLFRNIFNDKRRMQRIYKALTRKLIPLSDININYAKTASSCRNATTSNATASSLTMYAKKWPLARHCTRP